MDMTQQRSCGLKAGYLWPDTDTGRSGTERIYYRLLYYYAVVLGVLKTVIFSKQLSKAMRYLYITFGS